MYDGLWTVVFQTPIGIGSGVLVLSEGRLLGGGAIFEIQVRTVAQDAWASISP